MQKECGEKEGAAASRERAACSLQGERQWCEAYKNRNSSQEGPDGEVVGRKELMRPKTPSLLGRAYNAGPAVIAARTPAPVPEPEHPITDPARALAAASAIQPLRRAERFMLRMARAGTLAL